MENKLIYILDYVYDQLKFAEAKNGFLVAFISASIWGTLKATELVNNIIFNYCVSFYVLTAGIGLVISIASLFPRLNLQKLYKKDIRNANENLFYFRDLSKYSDKELFDVLKNKYNLTSNNKFIEIDLINQIIQNSLIVRKKYICFRFALWFVLIGFMPILIVIIAYLI
jgi:hypothetical protein